MKNLILTLIISFASALSFADGSHDSNITLKPLQEGPFNAGHISYTFDLLNPKNHQTLVEQDLVETHTKKLHFIVYDASLNEFQHVHPQFDGSHWQAQFEAPRNGNYFVWAQGKSISGEEFSVHVKTDIQGGSSENEVTPLGDHRKAANLGTVIELAANKLRANKMAMLNFKITREDGTQSEITPYLGAFAHVIAVSPDGEELIHVHPMEGRTANTGMLHATFPTSGDYRIWIQLIDKGELKTIPLSVSVQN